MESKEFDKLLITARETGMLMAMLLEGAADAGVDLRRATRNYRVWATALAVGTAAMGGWWVARRQQLRELPPPPPTPAETARSFIEDAGSKLLKRVEESVSQPNVRQAIEHLLPADIEPEVLVEQAEEKARTFVDTVLEPRLREGIASLDTTLNEGPWSDWINQARRFVDPDGTEGPRDETME